MVAQHLPSDNRTFESDDAHIVACDGFHHHQVPYFQKLAGSVLIKAFPGVFKTDFENVVEFRIVDAAEPVEVVELAASVVVLPEAEEFDIELNEKDIRKDTFCSSGPGGQSVNTTYSAIRLTHIPSGIVVTCQDEKSQIKNLAKAMKVLRTRLFEREYNKYLEEIASKRKTMVSTGDRSAKIRTYNWPQGRVTDHRIGLTVYNLPAIIDGDLSEFIEKLQMAENAERLKEGLE